MRTKILLADDQFSFQTALALWLEQAPDFHIVGVVTHGAALPEWIESTQPDILLLDWELPGWRTEKAKVKAIRACKARFPRLRIIALSSMPGVRQQVLAAGIHAFVSKTEPPDLLLDALQRQRTGPT